ncbi:MAG: hypothetical protein ACI9HK_001105 [Pirellulaceae bacterium]|jgi:hypothetical protein
MGISSKRQRTTCVILLLALSHYSTPSATAQGKPTTARVFSDTATIATREKPTDNWRIVRYGQELPASCWLQTDAVRGSRIELPPAKLALDAVTRLHLDQESATIRLERGRILIESGSSQWNVLVNRQRLRIPLGAKVQIGFEDDVVVIDVVDGICHLCQQNEANDAQETLLNTSRTITVSAAGRIAEQPLTPEQSASNIAWATPAPAQGFGQLLIEDSQSETPVRLDLARYHVNVVLRQPVALVQIDQSFYNPYSRQEEGTFLFNLPEGASVSRFAMYVTPTKLIEGELIERERADQIYTTIVASQRDPAILEQIGDNLFRMRVFPVFARDTKRILLDFTIPLESANGMTHFRLPLFSDLKPVWDFRLNGTIYGAPEKISTTLGDFTMRPTDGDKSVFEFSRQMYKPTEDFVVSYPSKSDDKSVRSSVIQSVATDQHAAQRRNYFMASVQPKRSPQDIQHSPPVSLVAPSQQRGNRSNV